MHPWLYWFGLRNFSPWANSLQNDLFDFDHQGDDISRIAKPCKIVERMVNQNTYDDIAQGNNWFQFNNQIASPRFL